MPKTPFDTFLKSQHEQSVAPATLKALRSDLNQFRQWWSTQHQRPFAIEQFVTRAK